MKMLIVLMLLVSTWPGRAAPHDPLLNPRAECMFEIGIEFVDNVRYCRVDVLVSQRLLDAMRGRDWEAKAPCLVLRKKVPGMPGILVDPKSFQLRRSGQPARLEGYVTYQVVLPYNYLYGGMIDIQSMSFDMLPVRRIHFPDTLEI